MSVPISLLSIPFALASNLLVMLGYTLQKNAAEKLPRIETQSFWRNLKNFFRSPVWLLGTFLAIFSFPTTFLAYSLGNISLVNSLSGTGLIFLAVFSWRINKEAISTKEAISYLIIAIGVSISGYYSSFTVTQEDFDVLWDLSTAFRGLLFLLFFIIVIVVGTFLLNLRKFKSKDGFILAFVGGVSMALAIICLKGASMVFAAFHISHLSDYRVLLFFLIYCIGALAGTILIQMAYQRERALQVVPVYHNLVHVIPILYGGLILYEWSPLSTLQQALLALGVFIVAAGIGSLAFTANAQKSND
ncbi:MAG: DMT family transporter [Candidatus Heimdallarchaeaceae archaeon]